jgi:hypothetical protein
MSNEELLAPDFCPGIIAYTGIRCNGTEARPTFGYVDAFGFLHCEPWYGITEAQDAADAQRHEDETKE